MPNDDESLWDEESGSSGDDVPLAQIVAGKRKRTGDARKSSADANKKQRVEEEDEDDEPRTPKRRAKSKAKRGGRSKYAESDDEDDFVIDDDEDSEDEFVPDDSPAKGKKGRAKAKATPKSKAKAKPKAKPKTKTTSTSSRNRGKQVEDDEDEYDDDDDDDDDSDSSFDDTPLAKVVAKKKTSTKKAAASKKKKTAASSAKKPAKKKAAAPKKPKKAVPCVPDPPENKWWLADDFDLDLDFLVNDNIDGRGGGASGVTGGGGGGGGGGGDGGDDDYEDGDDDDDDDNDENASQSSSSRGKKDKEDQWSTLVHKGVLFAPEYEPHGVPLLYDGREVVLPPDAEEVATYYTTFLETDYIKKPQFIRNFWKSWKKRLRGTEIKKLELCDFSLIQKHLKAQKAIRDARPSAEKKKEREEKLKADEPYMYALVDGVKQKLGNFRVEPPGLFRGRGEHPKMGTLKKRVMPEDITLNISKGAPIPPCPMEGHNWGKIIHNPKVTWLAMWRESINEGYKYVWFAAGSKVKGKSDIRKFELARRLHLYIDLIRKNYEHSLRQGNLADRQRSTALYLIDKLALRVGNDKDETEEADTVGCCSLRVEHVTMVDEDKLKVKLKFLGKDSIEYDNDFTVTQPVWNNLVEFMAHKQPDQQLFDELNPSMLNKHLQTLMPGLSAKVFRTYNASATLQRLLEETNPKDSEAVKAMFYNRANREVAVLCNHQKAAPKNHADQVKRMQEQLKNYKAELKSLKADLALAKKGERTRSDGTRVPGEDVIKKRIETKKMRIENKQVQITTKEDLKTVSLSTSKINYLDPRITVSWCKRENVHLSKFFTKTLIDKFSWALDCDKNFNFLNVPEKPSVTV